MPKNVQAFVNKYGRIGSKEQDATFWKEFRKAANAYADVQAKRICDLEHALTAVTEQRDEAVNNYETAQLLSVRVGEQRDRLAEALEKVSRSWNYVEVARDAIQSLTPTHESN